MAVNSRSSHWNVKVWGAASIFSVIGTSGRVFTFKNLRTGELFHFLGLGYGFGVGRGYDLRSLGRLVFSYLSPSHMSPPWADGWSNVNCFHPISANDIDLSSVALAEASIGAAASLFSTSTGATTYLVKARYSTDANVIPTQTNLARFTDTEFLNTTVSGDVREAVNVPSASAQISAQHVTLLLLP